MTETRPDQFTPEEWNLLLALPRETAIAAAIADPGGRVGATKAIVAAFKELVAGEAEYPGNALIAALLVELRTGTQGPEDRGEELEIDEAEHGRRLAEALAHARAANALLAAKVEPPQADEYRRWVVGIARTAVGAAKSGGFLGLGGERVTEEEAGFIADLRAALGMTG